MELNVDIEIFTWNACDTAEIQQEPMSWDSGCPVRTGLTLLDAAEFRGWPSSTLVSFREDQLRQRTAALCQTKVHIHSSWKEGRQQLARLGYLYPYVKIAALELQELLTLKAPLTSTPNDPGCSVPPLNSSRAWTLSSLTKPPVNMAFWCHGAFVGDFQRN